MKYFQRKKIKARELNVFFRQFASLMQSAIPLLEALEIIISESTSHALAALLTKIKEHVKNGLSLSEAFQQYPRYFNYLSIQLLLIGEQTGKLALMLENIADHREKTEAIRRKIKKALMYPLILLAVALGVTYLLMIFVVPQFKELFANFGADLPLLTQWVICCSSFIEAHSLLFILLLIIPIKIIPWCKQRFHCVDRLFHHSLLYCPFIGTILLKSMIAQLARTLALTVEAGVPLLETLQTSVSHTPFPQFKSAIASIQSALKNGQSLHQGMKNTDLFPNLMIQMVHIGEESGNLSPMLAKIADYYDNDIDHVVSQVNQLLEPLLMLLLGLIIGGLVIAMYLPIFKLGTVI